MFDLYKGLDPNSTGALSLPVLEKVLRESGRSDDDIAALRAADSDGNGHLSLEEFVSCQHSVLSQLAEQQGGSTAPYIVGFVQVDGDGSGSLSRDEFLHMLTNTSASHQYTQEMAQKLFEEADSNSDGKISYDEMVRFLERAAELDSSLSSSSSESDRRCNGKWPADMDDWLKGCPHSSIIERAKAHALSGGVCDIHLVPGKIVVKLTYPNGSGTMTGTWSG